MTTDKGDSDTDEERRPSLEGELIQNAEIPSQKRELSDDEEDN